MYGFTQSIFSMHRKVVFVNLTNTFEEKKNRNSNTLKLHAIYPSKQSYIAQPLTVSC